MLAAVGVTLGSEIILHRTASAGDVYLALVVVVCLGITDAIGMATRQTTVQLTTPDNMRGRAVSFHEVSAESANNIGTIEVGILSQQIGASYTMIFGGIFSIAVVAAVWVLVKGLRQYRYP